MHFVFQVVLQALRHIRSKHTSSRVPIHTLLGLPGVPGPWIFDLCMCSNLFNLYLNCSNNLSHLTTSYILSYEKSVSISLFRY